jgi:hypothetical protein
VTIHSGNVGTSSLDGNSGHNKRNVESMSCDSSNNKQDAGENSGGGVVDHVEQKRKSGEFKKLKTGLKVGSIDLENGGSRSKRLLYRETIRQKQDEEAKNAIQICSICLEDFPVSTVFEFCDLCVQCTKIIPPIHDVE